MRKRRARAALICERMTAAAILVLTLFLSPSKLWAGDFTQQELNRLLSDLYLKEGKRESKPENSPQGVSSLKNRPKTTRSTRGLTTSPGLRK